MLMKSDLEEQKCSAEDYFSQFCTVELEQWLLSKIQLEILIQAHSENEDFINVHLIPLSKWIRLAEIVDTVFPSLEAACKNVGDKCTVVFKVQVLKQVAKNLVKEYI